MKIFQLFLKLWRKIKFFIQIPFLELQAIIVDLRVKKSKQGNNKADSQKSLLIIKLDAIGDYVMFRNFLEETRKSEKFRDYKITLLGNIRYKDLALGLDKKFVDEFIWIDPSNLLGRTWVLCQENIGFIKNLNKNEYTQVLNPTYTRQYLIDRLIVKNIKALSKTGFYGDSTNTPSFLNRLSDRFYTKIIKVPTGTVFEFYRNKSFFEQVLGGNIDLKKPTICIDPDPVGNNDGQATVRDDNEAAIVIFPGAGSVDRQWSPKNFAEVIDYIDQKYMNKYDFLIMGGPGDMEAANNISKFVNTKSVKNIAGKSSLIELAQKLSTAKLLICNDTGAAHIAAALGTKTIFLLKGNGEFGRFGPYPPEISQQIFAILPPAIDYTEKNYPKLLGKRFFTTEMSDIKVDMVKKMIDKKL